ncbi:uncharacterized protein B0H18DRAFT_958600 [Fomitopsis serialis]|uniref:uncharacterized protein n=1 Tax=Fomitopsis serialis TaxID=139415 RepID=UPI002008B3AA|nr:uncharacterized protein B0H18DRAFT_958600 [Neoantrodia serialis]KAH9916847.1 hypothetical protein B0H18DRAFT_958600 [Neoantrodia serialis]
MPPRQSARNAARQSTSQQTAKPKARKAAPKSTTTSKKSSATKGLKEVATGSKRPRQETLVGDGKASQGDVLSPSEKKMYDLLRAKMEQAQKQAVADRRSNIQKTSTAMVLAEDASRGDAEEDSEEEEGAADGVEDGVEDDVEDDVEGGGAEGGAEDSANQEDDDEQPRRKKLKKSIVINSSDDEDRDQLIEEDGEVEAKIVEPDERPPRAKPKPKPAYGKRKTRDVESDHEDRTMNDTQPMLDQDELSLAGTLGAGSAAAQDKETRKSTRASKKIPDDGRTALTQPAKSKKNEHKVVDRKKDKGKAIDQKKKAIDWLDSDTGSESEMGREDDDDDDDDDAASYESGSDGDQEEGSEGKEMENDSDDEVIVVKAPKHKSQRSKGKGGRRGRGNSNEGKSVGRRRRAQARDLPETVKPIVTCSQMYLRLRLSLEHAWTSEKMQNSSQLPVKHTLIKRAIRDARAHRAENGKKISYLSSGFKVLGARGTNRLRGDVANVVWTGACQLRNEVKKKATTVVENAYALGGLSTQRRVAAATFLLKCNMQGKFSLPNFIFGDIDIAWQANDAYEVDTKASFVNRKKPFHHRAISDVMVQHWFHGSRDSASVAAYDRFAEVPNNLIALVCNAWANIMGVLDQFERNAPEAYESMKTLIWTNISALVDEQKASKLKDEADEGDGNSGAEEQFISWSDVEVVEVTPSNAAASVKKPSASKPSASKPSRRSPICVKASIVEASIVEAVRVEAVSDRVQAVVLEAAVVEAVSIGWETRSMYEVQLNRKLLSLTHKTCRLKTMTMLVIRVSGYVFGNAMHSQAIIWNTNQ